MSKRRRQRNDRIRREANDVIARVAATVDGDGTVFRFLCECNRADCRDVISLTVSDYRKLGASNRLLIVPQHYDDGFGLIEAVGRELYAIRVEQYGQSRVQQLTHHSAWGIPLERLNAGRASTSNAVRRKPT